jgi:hypothetical protein
MQPRDFAAPRPRVAPELMRFYKKRAQQLRTEAIVSAGLALRAGIANFIRLRRRGKGGPHMICRIWRGWTAPADADAYESYLRGDLFPRLERELGAQGYHGFHILRLARGDDVEFVTLVWFTSIDVVKAFAGDDYERPYISETAARLLSVYADRCDHFELAGTSWPLPA